MDIDEPQDATEMPPDPETPLETFDEILGWLDPDREMAGRLYVDLRGKLIKIFAWNRCADPEGMTDETFDRVARKVHRLKDSFEGNPSLYFYGVANNLIREYQKKIKSYVPMDDIELAGPPPQEVEEESPDMREECLRACLAELPREKRDLILAYYAKEKQAKIDYRIEMAGRLGVAIETLRVRMYRIRAALEECIERCLGRLADGK